MSRARSSSQRRVAGERGRRSTGHRSAHRERAVADDAAAVAGGVARGAQVEQLDRQVAARGRGQQAAERERAARPVGLDVAPPPGDDGGRGGRVEGLGGGLVVVVAEVGADDDQRLGPAPQRLEQRRRPRRRAPARRRPAAPTSRSPSTTCRNGSCTSRLCSAAWGRSSTTTPGRPTRASAGVGVDRDRRRAAWRRRRPLGSGHGRGAARGGWARAARPASISSRRGSTRA